VSVVAPTTLTKLVQVLPVASLVRVIVKASLEVVSSSRNFEDCWKVEIKVQLLKLRNIETCMVVAPPII
jgi:hypothetical protein